MRIVHILDRADVIGGVQTYLTDLLPALAERGIDSIVACGTSGDIGGVAVEHVPGIGRDGAALPGATAATLMKVIRSSDATLAVQHVAVSPGVTRAAIE